MNILVVDDNAILSMALADHLRDKGHNVSAALAGKQAQQAFEQRHFDLVVTDLVMPDIDGITLIETLRRKDHTFKAILISGFPELLDRVAPQSESVNPELMIEKPFSFSDIDAAVARIQQQGAESAATDS